MPAAARISIDTIATGHQCDSTAPIKGSLQSKVIIHGYKAAVLGDSIEPHKILNDGECITHGASIKAGSSKVTIENIPAARIGDAADQGRIKSGSTKCFIGG